MSPRVAAVIGSWGRPPDLTSRVALGIAAFATLLAITGRGRSMLGIGTTPLPRRMFLWLASFAAALVSIVYIAEYLRGGPRIIDATTYYLQGRAMAEGSLSWPVGDPTASFRGRFLLFSSSSSQPGTIGGIFPPGYPLLLSFGFALGAPLVIGPAIAAAIVVATHRLARTIAEERVAPELVEPLARAAALLSVVCAALRYHTADTMAHGATALFVAIALDRAIRAAREASGAHAILCGLALGMVVATRPISALPIAIVCAAVLAKQRPLLVRTALAALPGIAFLVLAQHAVTGAWLTSSQRMYYAISDGPPGCFRWGFGRDTGCLVEHPDFVHARLPHGYGPLEALLTTLRRLRMHVLDVANLEPLALLLLVPIASRRARVRAPLFLLLLQILAYAPFYFDGNYPGGGARFFADVLPVEHALLALAIATLARAQLVRGAFAVLALAFAGFGVHAAFDHVKLRDRDGGRPMFEPDLLQKSNVTTALVFVETDHGFALGHDPAARPKSGVLVARIRNDDRDRLLFDRLDRPPTYIYRFDHLSTRAQNDPALMPWSPAATLDTFRFEAEAEWPPLSQRGGFTEPVQSESCASQSRALALVPWPLTGDAEATITVPVPDSGKWVVAIRVVRSPAIPGLDQVPPAQHAEIRVEDAPFTWIPVGTGCVDVATRDLVLEAPAARVTLIAHGGAIAVDKFTLHRSH
jgi:hypothetical protein